MRGRLANCEILGTWCVRMMSWRGWAETIFQADYRATNFVFCAVLGYLSRWCQFQSTKRSTSFNLHTHHGKYDHPVQLPYTREMEEVRKTRLDLSQGSTRSSSLSCGHLRCSLIKNGWFDTSLMLVDPNSHLRLLAQHLGHFIRLVMCYTFRTNRYLSMSTDLWQVTSSHGSETNRSPPTSCTSHRVWIAKNKYYNNWYSLRYLRSRVRYNSRSLSLGDARSRTWGLEGINEVELSMNSTVSALNASSRFQARCIHSSFDYISIVLLYLLCSLKPYSILRPSLLYSIHTIAYSPQNQSTCSSSTQLPSRPSWQFHSPPHLLLLLSPSRSTMLSTS